MVLFPDVQAQAQAEIDNVIGNDKLPTVDDRKRLPFVSALAMEALRWHIVTPTGVPHRVMEDDIHDGYLIPEGALVLTNIWHVLYSLLITIPILIGMMLSPGTWLMILASIKILWNSNPQGSSRPKTMNQNPIHGNYASDLEGGTSVII